MINRLDILAAPEPDGATSGVWPTTLRRLDSGEFSVGGVPVGELVAEFGTPLYVLDEAEFARRARAWKAAMGEAFADLAETDVYYAGKAFLCIAVARTAAMEGLGVDTCTEGELATALAAGVPGSRIGLHGNKDCRRLRGASVCTATRGSVNRWACFRLPVPVANA